MRTITSVLVASLLALGFAFTPTVASAATPAPKVVIIVGPVGSMTSYYKADGDAAYAEALKYTPNVVKVYTPKATWAAAKAAMQGASVVIYMGHGNGFPSPYRSSPWAYSENGLGLNPTAGTDNTTTKYYGEYYLAREVKLAPNAVVLLHHLCYASGNSESGKPAPTLSVARQRVDNMAAGWLKTGARAVVAEGHYGPAWYVRQLFTTHKTIDQIWHDSPTYNGHAFTFPSVRTSGATAEMDPDGTSNGYWRALTGWLNLTTDQATGAAYAATDVDPTDFVVPGAASVKVDTGGVYPDPTLTPDSGTGMPASTLARDTKLRILSEARTTPDGRRPFQVATLNGAVTGWMASTDLLPRDSQSPVMWAVDDGSGAFSPNGDGHGDTFTVSGRISESATWTVRFKNGSGAILASRTGSGSTVTASWDGKVGGTPVADGTYNYTITTTDGWGNPPGTYDGPVVVDTQAPHFVDAASSGGPRTFSPNGDKVADSIAFGFASSEAGYVDAVVSHGSAVVRSLVVRAGTSPGSLSWDGRNDAGVVAPDGTYMVTMTPRDDAGNIGASRDETVAVYRALASVATTKTLFYPQDLDAYATTTRLSFTLLEPATVTWTVVNAAGAPVYTRYSAVALAAGGYAFNWNGRTSTGAMAPRGTYYSQVSATDGTLGAVGRVAVVANAYQVSVSDTTPARGQRIILTVTSAEALKYLPRVTVREPGIAAWTVTMTKTSAYGYRVTLTLKKGGGTGTVLFTIAGTDTGGRANRQVVSLPIH